MLVCMCEALKWSLNNIVGAVSILGDFADSIEDKLHDYLPINTSPYRNFMINNKC